MENIERKNGLKKSHKTGLVICIILMVLQIVSQIIRLTNVSSLRAAVTPIVYLILIVGFGYYALLGYKKPHGNMLRYLFLLYVICSCYFQLRFIQSFPFYVNAFYMVKIVAFTYVAGRLDKVNKNKYIMGVLILAEIAFAIYNIYTYAGAGRLNFNIFLAGISSLTFTGAAALAYIIRYDLHKEAGLADK